MIFLDQVVPFFVSFCLGVADIVSTGVKGAATVGQTEVEIGKGLAKATGFKKAHVQDLENTQRQKEKSGRRSAIKAGHNSCTPSQ